MSRRTQAALALVALAAAGVWVWRSIGTPRDREIRNRLTQLAAEFNSSTTDGLGIAARAARLGSYFTPDVIIELGQGSPPIQGRETLMAMAARLQPRTAAFQLELKDVTVDRADDASAEIVFTALIRRRSFSSGEQSIDAREFSATMRKTDEWRIAHVVAIDTLR
jgi:hypothetical protein